MKHILRIPTNEQYAYIETEIEGTEEEAIQTYRRITKLVKEKQTTEGYQKVNTFTGEVVLYNKDKHHYTDLQGNTLIGGSTYKASLEPPFDLENVAKAVSKKYGCPVNDIKDMWKRNGEISAGLGTALHAAMEQWFKHHLHGTEKEYHLPKHPFLRNAVQTFPYVGRNAIPEVFVSDVKNKRVGQIDLLMIESFEDKKAFIVDYKTDGDISKNIDGHFHQLSYYAHILMAKGWEISHLEVWNFTDSWTSFSNEVLPLITTKKK